MDLADPRRREGYAPDSPGGGDQRGASHVGRPDTGRAVQVADQVLLEVVNEGHGFRNPIPGRGLVNMRERARLEGGELDAGRIDGGFRVRAILPAVTAVSP